MSPERGEERPPVWVCQLCGRKSGEPNPCIGCDMVWIAEQEQPPCTINHQHELDGACYGCLVEELNTLHAALTASAEREREARRKALEEAVGAVCGYLGHCNSSRCPCRKIRALQAKDGAGEDLDVTENSLDTDDDCCTASLRMDGCRIYCTQKLGHKGDHVVRGFGPEVLHRWAQSPAAPAQGQGEG